MDQNYFALSLPEPLSDYYNKAYNQIKNTGKPAGDYFPTYDMETLMRPDRWYEALAVCEYAIESGYDVTRTQDFFEWIFKGFDCNASVDLNAEEYAWYWAKIQALFDKFQEVCPDVWVEKALQYFSARRGYVDKSKTLLYLQEGMDRGSEAARTVLGYHYSLGFSGVTDKVKGAELLNGAVTHDGKVREIIFKGYIALNEGRMEETRELLASLEPLAEQSPFARRMMNEQQAFLLERDGQVEEAAAFYRRVLEVYPSGFAMMRLGHLNYNLKIEGADQRTGLGWLEKAFRYGRVDTVSAMYYCYFESGEEWQDESRAVYWLAKGFAYNDDYSTYELAHLYLFNEAYQDIEKGLYYLDCSIQMKYVDAYVCKAYLLHEGEILEKSLSACMDLLLQAYDLGSGNAAYRIACMYNEGELNADGSPDYANALVWFEKAGEKKEAKAYDYLGRYALVGVVGEPDPAKAKEWYEKGIELGSPYCMVELAIMFEDANGVEEDLQKFYELSRKAAELDYAPGLYLLGRCYKYAYGTEEDPDKALDFFTKAAGQGHMKAQAELALCYEAGYGTEEDRAKALQYMKLSAEQGYPYSQYKMGCYYAYGLPTLQPDYEEAVRWLELSAENEYPYAMLELGDFYLYDYAEKNEQSKAYAYYLRAAESGCVNEGLGLCLEYGYGVETNEGEAFKYYLKGAEDGYIRAMYQTGLAYYFGTGVKINYSEAYRWLNDAAGNEHMTAAYYKGKMLLAGEGCPQDLEEGILFLQKAAENEVSSAQYELGNCYLVGKGVPENEDLAMEWFERAAENGHEQALKITGKRRRR